MMSASHIYHRLRVFVLARVHNLRRYGAHNAATRWLAARPALAVLAMAMALALMVQRRDRRHQHGFSMAEKVVVVTGGSSGIGLQLVQQLGKLGCRVVVLDIHPPPKSEDDETTCTYYNVDVSDRSAISKSASLIVKEVGEVDVLINNAGINNAAPGNFAEADIDRQVRIIEVNLLAHMYTNRAFLPSMIKRNQGHVVTVASAASFFTPPGTIAYGVSKTGLVALHEGLETETATVGGAPDVHFTIVHPYFVATPLIDGVFANTKSFLSAESVAASIVQQLRSGRGGQLFLPGWVGWTRFIRVLPRSVALFVRKQAAQDMVDNICASSTERKSA